MGIFKLSIILMTITSFSILAGERIKLGITGNIETDGFFSPIITSYTVNKVRAE